MGCFEFKEIDTLEEANKVSEAEFTFVTLSEKRGYVFKKRAKK